MKTPKTTAQLQREVDEQIAVDAILEGRMTEARQIIGSRVKRLSRTTAKRIANLLTKEGRIADATMVLVDLAAMGEERAKRELAPAPVAKVGDVLYTSGGYDETNVYYYEIVAVSGSMATVREIQKRIVDRGEYDNQVIGDRGAYVGPPKRVRVQRGYRPGEYQVKIGHQHAWQWDGKPRRETAAGYGH